MIKKYFVKFSIILENEKWNFRIQPPKLKNYFSNLENIHWKFLKFAWFSALSDEYFQGHWVLTGFCVNIQVGHIQP